MSDRINIGDTVEVTVPVGGETWRGEVLEFVVAGNDPALARVRCTSATPGMGVRVGMVPTPVPLSLMTRVGDPEGMRDDGCDDVDVTGRVRPYHRHAATGEAHAHPGGELAHTHQTLDEVRAMSRAASADTAVPPFAIVTDDPDDPRIAEVLRAQRENGDGAGVLVIPTAVGLSEDAAAEIVRTVTRHVVPLQVSSTRPLPPADPRLWSSCLRCGGDLLDHVLTAPEEGPEQYRCLRDELSDVIADLETSDPPPEPGWVEVLRHVETAYKRSLVVHEGPVVVTRGQHMADVKVAAMDAATLDACGATATVFAVLRDIADTEPIEELAYSSEVRCVMCGASATPVAGGRHPHLISCPWARAVEIVGRHG